MNHQELINKILKNYENLKNDWAYVGLRFENKKRELGEVCENSKHNLKREDEREFPDFNSDEYKDLQTLDGTSAWDLSLAAYLADLQIQTWQDQNKDWHNLFDCEHCYIIAGDETGNDDGLDDCEITIRNAQVIAIID
jgi:hypothetical protein